MELFLRQIPSPHELRLGADWQNAIEYRNLLVVGDQGSGKSTLTEALAYGLGRKYWNHPICAAKQFGGVGVLLERATSLRAEAYLLVGKDLTLAKIPRTDINTFFQVRHLIQARAGISRGIVITALETRTLFGIDKNLRSSFIMFLKSVPTNPYDRSLLKRYIDARLLESFELLQASHPELAVYWTR